MGEGYSQLLLGLQAHSQLLLGLQAMAAAAERAQVDVAAAVAYLKSQGSSQIVLAGYSFGAAMCLKTDLQVKPDAMVLVAPPIQMLDGLSEPEAPCLVLLGREDQIVAAEETAAWFRNSQVELIEGADHFFFGVHGEIKRLVSEQGADLWN